MSTQETKEDIQAFWKSLYASLYDDVDGGLTREKLFDSINDLEDMLQSDVAALLEETDLESLEEVLEDLKSDEFDSEDVLRELQETEELLNQESFEIDALNQELTQLANEFSETSELSAFSNSLEEMDFAAAADRLRELSESLSSMDASSRNELEEELRLEDFSESLSVEELLLCKISLPHNQTETS